MVSSVPKWICIRLLLAIYRILLPTFSELLKKDARSRSTDTRSDDVSRSIDDFLHDSTVIGLLFWVTASCHNSFSNLTEAMGLFITNTLSFVKCHSEETTT